MRSLRMTPCPAVPVLSLLAGLLALAWSPPADARVTRITILSTTSPAFCTGTPPTCPSFGTAGQYEVLTGLADGVLDPHDPLDAIIQDIDLGKDPGRQGPLHRHLPAGEARRHVEGQRAHVARHPEPGWPHHHRRHREGLRRRGAEQRLAGRQLGEPHRARHAPDRDDQRVGEGPGRPPPGRLDGDRRGDRPDRQPQRPGLAAALRAVQPVPLPAGVTRHRQGEPHRAPPRDDGRQGDRPARPSPPPTGPGPSAPTGRTRRRTRSPSASRTATTRTSSTR